MELERDFIDGLGHPITGTELHLQPVDLQQQAVDRRPGALGIEDLDIGLTIARHYSGALLSQLVEGVADDVEILDTQGAWTPVDGLLLEVDRLQVEFRTRDGVAPRRRAASSMAKKHKHPEHVNHERWLVSYADFITLLFATFTALYALSKSDASSKAKAVADGLREAFGPAARPDDPHGGPGIRRPSRPTSTCLPGEGNENAPTAATKKAGKQEFEEIKKRWKQFLMTKGALSKVQIDQQERGLRVSMKEGGFFESRQAPT